MPNIYPSEKPAQMPDNSSKELSLPVLCSMSHRSAWALEREPKIAPQVTGPGSSTLYPLSSHSCSVSCFPAT